MEVKIIEKDYPKTKKIKDGSILNIRLMKRKDENRILEFFAKIPEEDKIYLRENVADAKVIENYWIRRIEEGTSVTILAFLANELAGEATLHQDSAAWSAHVGHIRVNVAKEYRRKGIATVLLSEIYKIALKMKLEKICAEVIREQKKIMEIFSKRLGFKEEAVLRNHVKDTKGDKHNLIILSNKPSELLEEMGRHMTFHDIRYGQEY